MRSARIRVAALLSAAVAVASAQADTYTVTVNSTKDVVDATPGNGICATAAGKCTLRAAVQEANAHAGADTTIIDRLKADGIFQVTAPFAIRDVTLTHGYGPSGSALLKSGARATSRTWRAHSRSPPPR